MGDCSLRQRQSNTIRGIILVQSRKFAAQLGHSPTPRGHPEDLAAHGSRQAPRPKDRNARMRPCVRDGLRHPLFRLWCVWAACGAFGLADRTTSIPNAPQASVGNTWGTLREHCGNIAGTRRSIVPALQQYRHLADTHRYGFGSDSRRGEPPRGEPPRGHDSRASCGSRGRRPTGRPGTPIPPTTLGRTSGVSPKSQLRQDRHPVRGERRRDRRVGVGERAGHKICHSLHRHPRRRTASPPRDSPTVDRRNVAERHRRGPALATASKLRERRTCWSDHRPRRRRIHSRCDVEDGNLLRVTGRHASAFTIEFRAGPRSRIDVHRTKRPAPRFARRWPASTDSSSALVPTT